MDTPQRSDSSTGIPRLEIRSVSKRFDAVQALSSVTMTVEPGEIHALVGENGAGKSTLVGVITGLHQPDSGTVLLDGEELRVRSTQDARRAGIAAVFQDPNMFPHLSVAENIFTGQYPMAGPVVNRPLMSRRAKEKLSALGFDLDPDQMVAGLTVAEAQFVEIARAVDTGLKLLILDEPTSALTPDEAAKLYTLVRRLKAAGTSIIWISHRMEEIHLLADRITVMRDGQHVRTAPAADLDDDEMIRLMVGRSVVLQAVPNDVPLGPTRLSVRGLTRPGVFQDVSFDVAEGEIVGVAGLVGAGRTEIAQAIFGLAPGLEGEVKVDGVTVRPTSPRRMAAKGVSYLPEDRDAEGVIAAMPIEANIALPSLVRLGRWGFMSRHKERELAEQEKSALSIKGRLEDLVSSLSGGNRQKVALARWLATRPRVLLLDEPTHGIDVGTKAQVHDIMRNLARKERMAIVMVSSDLPEVLAVSDRVLVIRQGRIAADVPVAEATQESILAAATGRIPEQGDAA
ncbi:sugar ABC transporter ATP-binding protein [Raineyella fluvialis]|uniref:ATP-binding cassette domain-containing protein n=1 Tax=Raineyella fluvialis TaxID=2662261 RepID=A0A5Q2F7S1_9ACTN|nr:sugar ABC transporter ATP-binding protein [Raineyella fluvialis]QGF22879.1 ATP-binding cassette domain-containing protein [Raineyella fluvialis]